jgi:hypothetical protein
VFDDWCVFLKRPTSKRVAPTDLQYFTRIKHLAAKHGSDKLYDDFVAIYGQTNTLRDDALLEQISVIASGYDDDALSVDMVLSTLYRGMLAEENKTRTKLGKRVKRLGMHQLLLENVTPEHAANFSKGKTWRHIKKECTQRGF